MLNLFYILFSVASETVSTGEPDLTELEIEPEKAATASLDLSSPEEVRNS